LRRFRLSEAEYLRMVAYAEVLTAYRAPAKKARLYNV